MAKRTDIRKILIIGAGPIVIGQACEFDYSGSQACRALQAEGYEVILINSNPATIMTDPDLATQTYIEPITVEAVSAIIKKERPHAILPTMGGQTALNIARELYENGVLQQYDVALIGADFNAIQTAEDRDAFKGVVEAVGLESLQSQTVSSLEEAKAVAATMGFPLILRPAFTLGGSGGSIVYKLEEFEEAVRHGLSQSPISQVLLEESALGWKEYEFEVMRDKKDNVVIVCSVENIDPMGIHTGDSITVAPAQTLSDREYHQLRNASIDIIRKVGVDAGGCNIQFAVHPKTGRFVVIEMNPRVSRSSALVSKATGVPIAKISAKLAVGMTLDEIQNDITQTTPACFEPAIDYVVTKIPRFSFEKFAGTSALLSPQMKSVGEVMAIGLTFQESFQKALRGLEVGLTGFYFPPVNLSDEVLVDRLGELSANRLQYVYWALKRGLSLDMIEAKTNLDPWFLSNFQELIDLEKELSRYTSVLAIPPELLKTAKAKGFGDEQIAKILSDEASNRIIATKAVTAYRKPLGIGPSYKAVDTCAGEFEAHTPYFYGSYAGLENEVPVPISEDRPKVVIIGGGPNRIGQGIEFDYCCVQAAFALEKLGYAAVMVNSNPETVSTDYDISDRLYFEPLTPEDVLNVLHQEQPLGVITQLGGQTPLKLAQSLKNTPYTVLGTSIDSLDAAEDRERFATLLEDLELLAPRSGIARTIVEALAVADDIGYPLIARPSYVLGGQAMRVFYNRASFQEYLHTVVQVEPDRPVLIDRFLEAAHEVDVDALSDGNDILIGGILEHVEHAGVHSGDSVCVFPAQNLSAKILADIEATTRKLASALNVKGLLNIQFAIKDDQLYVLEVNPRASRTVPFICKATNRNLVELAVRIMLGETLADIQPEPIAAPLDICVKAPVFPFIKFRGTDPKLGPEMRSTGEVMGIDHTFGMAFAKAQMGAGVRIPRQGTIFISLNNTDKLQALPMIQAFNQLGFTFMATTGTAQHLKAQGITAATVSKKHEGSNHIEDAIAAGVVQLVINTPAGESALSDDSYIRKAAIAHQVPLISTVPGAMAFAEAIKALTQQELTVTSLQNRATTMKAHSSVTQVMI